VTRTTPAAATRSASRRAAREGVSPGGVRDARRRRVLCAAHRSLKTIASFRWECGGTRVSARQSAEDAALDQGSALARSPSHQRQAFKPLGERRGDSPPPLIRHPFSGEHMAVRSPVEGGQPQIALEARRFTSTTALIGYPFRVSLVSLGKARRSEIRSKSRVHGLLAPRTCPSGNHFTQFAFRSARVGRKRSIDPLRASSAQVPWGLDAAVGSPNGPGRADGSELARCVGPVEGLPLCLPTAASRFPMSALAMVIVRCLN